MKMDGCRLKALESMSMETHLDIQVFLWNTIEQSFKLIKKSFKRPKVKYVNSI